MLDLSVVIPLKPEEDCLERLREDLALLPDGVELLLVYPEGAKAPSFNISGKTVRLIPSKPGRAQQLNYGADLASNTYLWFLHADSRFVPDTVSKLYQSIKQSPEALHYFNLEFYGGSSLMKLNAAGAWLRSHLLGIPFGDQGFCLSKELFQKIGAYPEDVLYGEDHLFVWYAKQQGIRLSYTGSTLLTSPRKYQCKGWLYVTISHQYLWIKQAFPEWIKTLFRKRT
ncbi:MAG: glycosyltransferase involved in cell wall biosynthesis [Chlamydiales bacterium]|jgi:glycosyltransferase involved in cell wall biosynthesis